MEYRNLGNTDLKISAICLGSMTWGSQNTEKEAYEQLDYALTQGVNFIDTAELYAIPPKPKTFGTTETIIGNWLTKTKKRGDVVLASKVTGNSKGLANYIRNGPRLNRQQMTEALNGSLGRLQTDYLDLYQIHWPARTTNYFGQRGFKGIDSEQVESIEETLSVLNDFVVAGKVRHIGISNETPWGMMQYLKVAQQNDWPKVQSIQNPYSLLNRLFEVGLAEISLHEEVGLLAYSPLGFGVLSGKYLHGQKPKNARLTITSDYGRYSSENAVRATAAYAELAREHNMTPSQMALAFVNSRKFVTSNIIGATSMEQLQENIGSIEISLSEEVIGGIEKIHSQIPDPSP